MKSRKIFCGLEGWVGLVGLIIGLGLTAFSVWFLYDTVLKDFNYVRIEAEVVDIAEVRVRDSNGHGYYTAFAEIVEYEVSGKKYRAQNTTLSNIHPKNLGGEITVAYDPDNPEVCFFPSSYYSFVPVAFVIAAGFLTVGVVLLRLDYKERKMEKLLSGVPNAEFVLSAASKEQFIKTDKPIIAVSGKSNVGKSSFINMITHRKKLAKVSKDPGRTRLINYFDCGKFILADLPGYGYAKVSRGEKVKWAKLLDDFFADQNNVTHVFSLADIRHEPTADDKQMIEFMYYRQIPFTVIATKADKLSRAGVNKGKITIAQTFKCGADNVIATSAQTGQGLEEVFKRIESIINTGEEDA